MTPPPDLRLLLFAAIGEHHEAALAALEAIEATAAKLSALPSPPDGLVELTRRLRRARSTVKDVLPWLLQEAVDEAMEAQRAAQVARFREMGGPLMSLSEGIREQKEPCP